MVVTRTPYFRVYKHHTGNWRVESLNENRRTKGVKNFDLKNQAESFARDIAKKNRAVLTIENARGETINKVEYQ